MLDFWNHFLYPLLSSPATTSAVAIIAATGAFVIYYLRRRDNKKDAVNIVILEIKNAERNLDEARKVYEDGKQKNPNAIFFPERLRLMPTESWTKYKYLFVRDLSPNQWDEISKFYENCKNFDEAVELKDSSFKQNATEIRVNIQRIVAEYAKELADKQQVKENDDSFKNIKERKDRAVHAITNQLVESYGPDKPFNDAAYYFALLPRSIINTPTGEKLAKLSKRNIFF